MVDDEARFRENTTKLLEKRGFETTMAGTGEEALAILKKQFHDVVIMDIKMPGMDGHAALAKVKEINADIQVIMLTGHGTPDSAQQARTHEAFDYLSKPCDIAILASRINDAYLTRANKIKEEKTARDIMIPIDHYTSVTTEVTVREAIMKLLSSFKDLISTERLMETGHRSLLVFDKKNNLVGVLSILDLLKAIRPAYLSAPKPSTADSMQYSPMFWTGLFTFQTKKLADMTIANIMSDTPEMIDENANLMEVADLMFTKRRRLLVTSHNKIIGIVREQEIFFEIANIILDK
jgi:CheY-like chemotaxis protein